MPHCSHPAAAVFRVRDGLGLMDERQTLGGIEFAIRASTVVSA
jgi:hypothetical protein